MMPSPGTAFGDGDGRSATKRHHEPRTTDYGHPTSAPLTLRIPSLFPRLSPVQITGKNWRNSRNSCLAPLLRLVILLINTNAALLDNPKFSGQRIAFQALRKG